MKKILLIVLSLTLVLGLSACSKGNEGMDKYIGNTYVGTSPWGGEVKILVDNFADDKISFTYRENIVEEGVETAQVAAAIQGLRMENNTAELSFKCSSDTTVQAEYTAKFQFEDGKIKITYIDGQKTESSKEGGSGFHHVGSLDEGKKTITLKYQKVEEEEAETGLESMTQG